MNAMRILIVAVALLAGALPAPASVPPAEDRDQALRAALAGYELRDLDGTTLSVAKLRDEVVVLHFWATWCTPCRRELPELDALHTELETRGGRVVAVSIDHEVRNVRSFVRRYRLALPVYHDGPDGLARTLALEHLPYTVVIDREGHVAHVATRSDATALATLREITRTLVERRPVAHDTMEGALR
jgi:peroxiredoxin